MSAVILRRARPVTLAAVAALLVALTGATMTDLGSWYQQLVKPGWQPPDWLFGPAWTLIFALTALSAEQSWRHSPRSQRAWLVGLFCLNGFLNILWSLLFFRLQRPDWALLEVVILWLSIVWLIVVVRRHCDTGAWLLVPYLLWVAFAGYLNLAVVRLNAPF